MKILSVLRFQINSLFLITVWAITFCSAVHLSCVQFEWQLSRFWSWTEKWNNSVSQTWHRLCVWIELELTARTPPLRCPSLQVTLSPGSLQETAGSIRPALPLRCRWRLRPVTEPQTTATSLGSRSCQVGNPTKAWLDLDLQLFFIHLSSEYFLNQLFSCAKITFTVSLNSRWSLSEP